MKKSGNLKISVILLIFTVVISLFLMCLSACDSKSEKTNKNQTTAPETTIDDITEENINYEELSEGTEHETLDVSNTEEITIPENDNAETIHNTVPPMTTIEVQRKYINFLNGSETTKEKKFSRPIAVMIDNIKAAMPTHGLTYADIIYECIVEGGQTRLLAVFSDYKDVPVIGAVRSSREYYIDLVKMHDAIYVHGGGSNMAYQMLYERKIDRLDGVNMNFPNTFYRDSVRRQTMSVEHTMMASGKGIVKGIEEAKYRTSISESYSGVYQFWTAEKDITGNIANYIRVPFSSSYKPEFIYNETDKLYYRNEFGVAQIDGTTGYQLAFKNVVILFVEYKNTGDKYNHMICDLTGKGYGFYMTNGKYEIIRWQRNDIDAPMNLYNLDNSTLYLNPGKTFVSLTTKDYNKNVVVSEEKVELKKDLISTLY